MQRDIRKSSSILSMTIPFFFSLLSPRPPPQNYGKSCVSKLSKKKLSSHHCLSYSYKWNFYCDPLTRATPFCLDKTGVASEFLKVPKHNLRHLILPILPKLSVMLAVHHRLYLKIQGDLQSRQNKHWSGAL